MDRFRMLEAFVHVTELGSFTRAAEKLHAPRATVTELVKALEARVGTTLLHRTTRRVALTQEGATFYERAVRILQDLTDAEDDIGGERSTPRGRLRVDVTSASGRHIIAPALPSFFARHPDIELELGSTDRPVDLLGEGVDCVIRGGDVHDTSLVAKKLIDYDTITCAAPAYLRAYGMPESPHTLEAHVFVNFFSAKNGRIFENEFLVENEVHGVRGGRRLAANDADTFLAAGVAGVGLVQLPLTRHVRGMLDAGKLVRVLEAWEVPKLPIYAMWPRRRDRSARIHAFVSWVAELFASE